MKVTYLPTTGVNRGVKAADYVPPPRDKTPVDARIVRRCWVALIPGDAPVDVAAGSVIRLPRWLADELVLNGKAELLHRKVVRLPGG